jgi:O-antigen ligase
MTEEERRVALSVWAAVVSFVALLYLTGSFWKAATIGVFVLVSCVLGFGQRWLLRGSFAIAIVAIAIALGVPSPDQWPQLLEDARRALFAGVG